MLLHAGPRVTADALPAIIAGYRERGFTLRDRAQLLGIPPGPSWRPRPARARRRGSISHLLRSRAVRSLDVAGGDGPPVAAAPPDNLGDSQLPEVAPAAPASPAALAAPAASPGPRPAARDAAWARGDEALAAVAGFTAVLLAVILLVAAVAGRGHRVGDDDPA